MSRQSRIFAALWILTIAFCIALVGDLLPWLRGDVPWLTLDEKWIWPYSAPRWLWVLPCALGIVVYVLGAIYLLERERASRYPLRLILWAFGGAVLLPLLLMTMEGQPLFLLFTRTASTVIGGYQFAANLSTDLGNTLRNWPQFVVDYRKQIPPGGIALSPPGLIALFYGTTKGFAAVPPLASTFDALVRPLQCQNHNMMTWSEPQMASAWIQMGMPLWAATAVAPLYALGRSIFNQRTAQWAVALWPLVPGLDIFSPRFNVFYALMALVMLVFLWRGLDRRRLLSIGLAGFVLSVGMFANLSLIPLGLLAGLTILGHWAITGPDRRIGRLAANLIAFGVGSLSVWVIYSVLSGVSMLDVYRQGFAYHSILNRPYGPWLILHTYDTFLWVGLPVAALAVWRILRIRREPGRADLFAGAIALTMIIMVFSGTARGETGRVWLFFAGIWLLLAANILLRLQSHQRVAVLIMEALCLFSMAAVLRANFTELTVVPSPVVAEQGPAFPVNARFVQGNDAVTFVGLSVDKEPTSVKLMLHWRADTYVKRPYILTLVPVPPDKSARASVNWIPGPKEDYPPACWIPGQEFIDTVSVPLGDNPQAGDWLFSLSIIDQFTRQPMTVAGQNTTQVGIGPVHIGP